jgi:phosphate:Na+ symporter
MVVLAFLKLLGCLGMLMYGMNLLSESLQKMAGNKLRHILDSLATNRMTSLLTGALVTAMLQSSVTSSLLTVRFVHAGMLSLSQSLPILMGASVGNTLIAWIMAIEYNYEISAYIYPLMLISMILVYMHRQRLWGESLFGLSFIILSLGLFYHYADEIQLARVGILNDFLSFGHENYGSYLVLLVIGALLTFLIQSSAVLMAVSILLCATGVWSIYSGVAFVLGENIGRALLTWRAARQASLQARRTALGQMLFNIGGVAWVFFVFPYIVDYLCDILLDSDMSPLASVGVNKNNAYVLAAFHTGFNLCNATLFICFLKPLETLCNKALIRKKGQDDQRELRFIVNGPQETPELSAMEARKEILNYAYIVSQMFMQTRYLFSAPNDVDFNNTFAKIQHYEEVCDDMEIEIANYLNKISDERLSAELKNTIRGMLRQVSEIESIGDSCFHIARTTARNYKSEQRFSEKQLDHLHQMFQLVEQAFGQMKQILAARKVPKEASTAYYIENEINNFRKQLRSLNIIDVNSYAYSYLTGTMYMDIINECEQMADCMINVTEARLDEQNKERNRS